MRTFNVHAEVGGAKAGAAVGFSRSRDEGMEEMGGVFFFPNTTHPS